MLKRKMKTGALLLLSVLVVSCSHTTVIRALDKEGNVDKDVSIYVDGSLKGQGEVEYSDKRTIYSTVPYYEMKKDKCLNHQQQLHVKLDSLAYSGWVGFSLVGIVLGVYGQSIRSTPYIASGVATMLFAFLPFTWSRDYVDLHEHEFQCVKID